MGLITEHDRAVEQYQPVALPPDPVVEASQGTTVYRRRSVQPSRRAVLYLRCPGDPFVPEDLAAWYTERGFNFYVAELGQLGQPDRSAGQRRGRGRQLRACFAGLDAARAQLRAADGIDGLIVCAHGAAGPAAARWCAARRGAGDGPVDALVLSAPAFGRGLRHGLDIACPVLVICPPGADAGRPAGQRQAGPDGGAAAGRPAARKNGRDQVWLGQHVTWLRIDDGLASGPGAAQDRRRFFDEIGRWLGAYMYGQVRDQLL